MDLNFYFALVLALLSSSFSVAVSIFSSRFLHILGRVFALVFISSLLCLFVMQSLKPKSVSPGQNIERVMEITVSVLEDSREINGGKSIFPVKIISAKDRNLTITSSSGELTVISGINLYKGQVLRIRKKNILTRNSSIIFIDRKNISILNWKGTWSIEVLIKRAKILEYLKNRIGRMSTDTSVLFSALIAGVKENPNGELFSSLRKAGASHLLALSGMHLGIISFGLLFVLTPLLGRRIGFMFTLFIVLFYVFLIDAGPSLTRALILFSLIGLFFLSGIKVDIFHILTLCFLIQVLLDPAAAGRLSFKLSYLALCGIILGSGQVFRILPGLIPPGMRGVLSASICAQFFTAPLVLQHFGIIYPIGVITGIILVPSITLFIWIGIITLLPIPWFFQSFLFLIMDKLYKIIRITADFFSQFPGLERRTAIWLGLMLLSGYLGFHIFKLHSGVSKTQKTIL